MNVNLLARLGSRLLVVVTLAVVSAGSSAALTGPSPGTFSGKGFDRFTAPTQDEMTAWLASSPYRAVGI